MNKPDLHAAQAEKIRQYGAAWDDGLLRLRRGLAQGWDMAAAVADWNACRARAAHLIEPEFQSRILELDYADFADAPAGKTLTVNQGRYETADQTPPSPIFPLLRGLIDDDVDCIVEFGSGLGFNLAQLRVELGPRPITYVACEPTESGRRAAATLFAAAPDTAFAARHFDYLAPDLSHLSRFRKIVAFSNHSIEQITVLGDAFHRALLQHPVHVCLHAEPVGWQRFAELREFTAELSGDLDRLNDLAARLKIVLTDSMLPQNAMQWSVRHLYNTDLLSVLDGLARAGLLKLRAVQFDAFAANPLNPSTILIWTKP